MQEKETPNPAEITAIEALPAKGRIISIDPGTKRIGVAVSDELQILARPVRVIARSGWKKLLLQIKDILTEFDAVALVIGLPYNFDGTESEMSEEARRMARNFSKSLNVPVFLQDERATTYAARGRLWEQGLDRKGFAGRVDSEAASIILSDFLDRITTRR